MQRKVDEQVFTEALRVLRSLLLGVDPETHERLSTECVVNQPEVKVALHLGIEAVQTWAAIRRFGRQPPWRRWKHGTRGSGLDLVRRQRASRGCPKRP